MFKFTILAFILSTMMFFSCSDSENSNNLINPEIAETYYPMEENMMWMYDDYSDGIFTEVTVSIIGKEILNGKSYYAFQQSGANSPSYFREESGIIYALIPAISQEQEFPMYRSDYTLGEKWEINYSVNGTEITESFEVMEIGFLAQVEIKMGQEMLVFQLIE